jgi:predicted DNA-binding protein with PD1-like motif/glutaredoxin
MRTLRLHLAPGSDLRHTLQQLAAEEQASGFVLGVVGNLSQAAFQCPGQSAPTVLQGELEIITLNGTLAPEGVHLHLSVSDGACQVWGGHLEPGSRVFRGADLLVGLLDAGVEPAADQAPQQAAAPSQEPRVGIAVLPGCPYSARALRLLRTLAIPHVVEQIESQEQAQRLQQLSGRSTFPQVFIDGEPIGGYDALVSLHGSGHLESLRQG